METGEAQFFVERLEERRSPAELAKIGRYFRAGDRDTFMGVHKPVGGHLREAGRTDRPRLLAFLDDHAATMPRRCRDDAAVRGRAPGPGPPRPLPRPARAGPFPGLIPTGAGQTVGSPYISPSGSWMNSIRAPSGSFV